MEEQATNTAKRPTFLTVLGILSFIGCGFQIIYSGIMGLLGGAGSAVMSASSEALQTSEALQNLEGMENVEGLEEFSTAATDVVSSGFDFLLYLGIANIVAAIICLIGVIMMWKLKKTGFYLYVIGEIGAPIVGILLAGFGYFTGFAMVTTFIFPLAFIIMYGLNLKHMK